MLHACDTDMLHALQPLIRCIRLVLAIIGPIPSLLVLLTTLKKKINTILNLLNPRLIPTLKNKC